MVHIKGTPRLKCLLREQLREQGCRSEATAEATNVEGHVDISGLIMQALDVYRNTTV
jgi:hypothetical protein